jgi:hypothetical protein
MNSTALGWGRCSWGILLKVRRTGRKGGESSRGRRGRDNGVKAGVVGHTLGHFIDIIEEKRK